MGSEKDVGMCSALFLCVRLPCVIARMFEGIDEY
jgi:hypothetical protein